MWGWLGSSGASPLFALLGLAPLDRQPATQSRIIFLSALKHAVSDSS